MSTFCVCGQEPEPGAEARPIPARPCDRGSRRCPRRLELPAASPVAAPRRGDPGARLQIRVWREGREEEEKGQGREEKGRKKKRNQDGRWVKKREGGREKRRGTSHRGGEAQVQVRVGEREEWEEEGEGVKAVKGTERVRRGGAGWGEME